MALPFVQDFSVKEILYAFLFFAIFFLLGPWLWILSFFSTTFIGALVALWAQKRIGGVSGDVLGTIEVLAELCALAAIALFTL
jgi:cobalamin synthase